MLRAVTTNRAALVRATCGSTPRGKCPSRVRLAAPPGRGGGADARGFRARARARARDLRKRQTEERADELVHRVQDRPPLREAAASKVRYSLKNLI
jgi:hypothetical protein